MRPGLKTKYSTNLLTPIILSQDLSKVNRQKNWIQISNGLTLDKILFYYEFSVQNNLFLNKTDPCFILLRHETKYTQL